MTKPAAIIAAAILAAISASTALAVSANTNVNLVILSYAVFQSPDPSSVVVTITKSVPTVVSYVGGTIRCNYTLGVTASVKAPADSLPGGVTCNWTAEVRPSSVSPGVNSYTPTSSSYLASITAVSSSWPKKGANTFTFSGVTVNSGTPPTPQTAGTLYITLSGG
ncbi:MAG: hypothetical protein WCK05_08535 [Planctomycetota bacterium]